jgi:hypothetical protein
MPYADAMNATSRTLARALAAVALAATVSFAQWVPLGACPTPQPVPDAVTFFVLPEGGFAPPPSTGYQTGDESKLRGTATPPGGPAISYVFDFAEDQRIDRNGYVSLLRPPGCATGGAPGTPVPVVDFRLRGRDLALGVDLTLTPAPGGAGTWTSAAGNCQFPVGAAIVASMNCAVAVSDPALAALFPATATLTLTGTPVVGNYHQIVLLSGSLAGVPSTSFKLHLKQDLHEGCITWHSVAIAGAATAETATSGGPVALRGAFGLRRNPYTWTEYALVDVALEVASNPQVFVAAQAGLGGTISLDPVTHAIAGTLTLMVDGAPVVRTLDGVGDYFEGSPTMPTRVVLTEANLGALTQFSYDGERPAILPQLNDFEIGQVTQLAFRARPGDFYVAAASFTPVPGVNQPVGDVFLTDDWLFYESIAPSLMPQFLFNNQAFSGPEGVSTVYVAVPAQPSIVGLTLYFAGATFDFGAQAIRTNTNVHRATLK